MRLRRILWCVALVGALAVAGHGQVAGANYLGSRLCIMCHRTNAAHAKIVEGFPQTAHAKAMLAATDAGAIVADFTGAPFAKDQVAWVLSSGRHEQAYLDRDLKVLPGLWLVAEKKWVPQEAVDGATQCVGCHVTGYDPAKKTWKQLGVGCERCHGPGSKHMTAATDAKKTTILLPSNFEPQVQAMACGQCHSRGKSKDGQYAFPHGYLPGTKLSDVYEDAKPQEKGRNQQFSDLMQSPKHWDQAVVCEKCHDPHGNTAQPYQLTMAIDETCLQCHKDKIPSLAEHVKAKGKTAPEGATCATCHMPDGRHLFDKSLASK